jgi:RNA-directed DNA polymerase
MIQRCQDEVTTWRHTLGVTLKPSKTRLTHTLETGPEKPGCDFLGFHVQQYPAGKTRSGRDGRGRLHGFRTAITPSPPAIQRQVDALRQTIARHKPAEQARLIQALNPQSRGWSQY